MYYENRYVRVTGTFKPLLMVLGAVAAPLALLLVPPLHQTTTLLIPWGILLAFFGAMIGTVVGYWIDGLIYDVRASRSYRAQE